MAYYINSIVVIRLIYTWRRTIKLRQEKSENILVLLMRYIINKWLHYRMDGCGLTITSLPHIIDGMSRGCPQMKLLK